MEEKQINSGVPVRILRSEGYSDTINLTDYIKTIIKRWKIILIIAFGLTMLVFLVSFFSPKIYDVAIILEIGTSDEKANTPIEPLAKIKEKVESAIYEGIGAKTEIPAGINIIKMHIKSSDINGAKTILEKISSSILAEHHKLAAFKKEIIEQQIEKNRTELSALEKEKRTIENTFKPLTEAALSQQPAIFQLSYLKTRETLEDKINAITRLESETIGLTQSLNYIQDSKIIKPPTTSKPLKPKILFNTLIALILGLFIGLVTAFCTEWWQKARYQSTNK